MESDPTDAPDPATRADPAGVGAEDASAQAPDFERPEDKPELTDEERRVIEESAAPLVDTPPEDAESPAEGAPEGTLGRRGTLVDEASPAGAVWPDADQGFARQHGEPSPGLGVTPAGDGDDTAEDNERQVLGVTEPEQVETTRPDIGTPTEEDE